MAKLTYVYRSQESQGCANILRRQIPVVAGDNLVMLMDLNSKGLCIDSPPIRGKELDEFTRKFNLLTSDELRQSLEIDSNTLISVLNQCVQCVGCRRRVELLFHSLSVSGYPTLDPLVLKKSSILTLNDEKMKTPQSLGTVLYRHHEVLNSLLENKLRNKTRCALHSMDSFRTKPFSETWREVWSSMRNTCRDELAVIETKELHETLENYLKKHKFCQGCRTKIEKAYKILVGETTAKEKGYVAALYANIKKCQPDKHIHVVTNKLDFLDQLIRRAEPEVNGCLSSSYTKQRERHAKTLEIAQEEVLTCVGILMYERLRRVYISLREEDRACQVLAAVGVHALCRSFDTFVEKKQGISNLELLYKEISRAEKAKELKREQKKLKKKLKKTEKKNLYRDCETEEMCDMAEADDDEPDDSGSMGEDDEGVEMTVENNIVENLESQLNQSLIIEANNVVVEKCCENMLEKDTMPENGKQTKKRKSQKQLQKPKQKTPQKKSKKKQKQPSSTRSSSCSANISVDMTPPTNETTVVESVPSKCNDCLASTLNCPCENDVKDSGYGSEPTSHINSRMSSVLSTSEGSEVSCSDGFCNHEHGNVLHDLEFDPTLPQCSSTMSETSMCCQQNLAPLSLQQMLDYFDCSEINEDLYIPEDVVREFQYKRDKVDEIRQQLRETLKLNFERLCMQNCK